jgi:hypothetical protein
MLLSTIPSGTYYFGDVLELIDNKYNDFIEEYKNDIFSEIKINDEKYYITLVPIVSDVITYIIESKEINIEIKNGYFGIITPFLR